MGLFSSEYKKTFDQIIQPIAQVVADLETHVTKNNEAEATKTAQAAALTAQANEHSKEAARATAAKAKFQALIS